MLPSRPRESGCVEEALGCARSGSARLSGGLRCFTLLTARGLAEGIYVRHDWHS